MSLVGALQQALATEHEAVYGYGVVGAHSPVIAPLTRSATQHKQVGDRLIEHFGTLQALFGASANDLQAVEGVGESRARVIRDGLVRLAESAYTDRLA